MDQIDLFAELPPGGKAAARRAPCKRKFRTRFVQLSFELVERVQGAQDDDDPWVATPIVHRTVSAKGATPLAIRAPASVWDMAFTPIATTRQAQPAARSVMRVQRGEGWVKCVRILPQETDEWKEREAARRARQRPPKPTKQAKIVGKGIAGLPEWD